MINWTATHDGLPFNASNLFEVTIIGGMKIIILLVVGYRFYDLVKLKEKSKQ